MRGRQIHLFTKDGKIVQIKMSDAKFDAAFAKGDKDGSGGIGMK